MTSGVGRLIPVINNPETVRDLLTVFVLPGRAVTSETIDP
jgi:hypothetical protein